MALFDVPANAAISRDDGGSGRSEIRKREARREERG